MTTLSQARDMFRLQKQAKKVKKELKNIHVEAESPGVKVVVNGNQEVVSVEIAPGVSSDTIVDCMNRALKKSQIVASERMQGVMGEMGLPTEKGMRGMGG